MGRVSRFHVGGGEAEREVGRGRLGYLGPMSSARKHYLPQTSFAGANEGRLIDYCKV